MRRMKIYLDTSVISYLDQQDSPENMQITRELWEYFKLDECEICLSEAVLEELHKCPELKLHQLIVFLGQIHYTLLKLDDEAMELAEKYISEGVLARKHLLDLIHLATASVNDCNILLSWNFSHIVQHKTMTGVNATNKRYGYGELLLLSPFSFKWKEE
jgi:PIN domain.